MSEISELRTPTLVRRFANLRIKLHTDQVSPHTGELVSSTTLNRWHKELTEVVDELRKRGVLD